MIDIYDKEKERQASVWGGNDADANGCALTLPLLMQMWGRLIGQVETKGRIDWTGVKLKSHPNQLAAIEAQKLQATPDVFKVFENFQGQVDWTVDDKIRRDALQMKIGEKVGTWVRLSFINYAD